MNKLHTAAKWYAEILVNYHMGVATYNELIQAQNELNDIAKNYSAIERQERLEAYETALGKR